MRVPWLLFAIVLGVAATSLAEAGVAVDLKTPWLRRSMRTTTICARSKRNLPRCIAARAWSGPRPARYGSKKPARCDGSTVLPRSRLSAMVKVCVVLRPGGPAGTKTAAKKLEDVRSPLAFLLGKTKLEKELQGLSLAPDVSPMQAGNIVLRGVPQALADRVSEILLEVTPEHEITRIVIQEVDGAATE